MIRPVSTLAALVAAPALCVADDAQQPTPPDTLATGARVFEHWCAPCHAATGMMPGTIALEAKYEGAVPAVLEERTDLTPELVAFFVRQGVSVMAPFRKTEISDDELDALSLYLSTPPEERDEALP